MQILLYINEKIAKIKAIYFSLLYRNGKILYYISIKIIRGTLLLEKKLKKASLKTMALTIKKSKGIFFGTLVMLLIPIIFISSYTFYADYSEFALDYSAFDSINISQDNLLNLLNNETLNNFLIATEKSLSSFEANDSSTVMALNIINFVLKILIFSFAAVFAIYMERDEKTDLTTLITASAKRILGLLFVSVFVIWIFQQAYNMFFSLILTTLILQNIANVGILVLPSAFITFIVITFLAALVLVHLYFTVITVCKKRTRAIFAFSYSRSIIKGKKQVFKLLLWVLVAFTVPVLISAIAPFIAEYNIYFAVGTFALGEVLFIVLNMLAIIYIEPRHTAFEIESNIVNKLRQAQMEAFKAAGVKFEDAFLRKENKENKENDVNNDNLDDKIEENKENEDARN